MEVTATSAVTSTAVTTSTAPPSTTLPSVSTTQEVTTTQVLCEDVPPPVDFASHGFTETDYEILGPGDEDSPWLFHDARNPEGNCNYGWRYDNTPEDENLALELALELTADAGFTCEWFDYDAEQTFVCTRGDEHLKIDNIGFIEVWVLWQVPQET